MMTFAREALPWATLFALPAIFLFATGRTGWAVAFTLMAAAVALFFRVPARDSAAEPEVILSPASGLVTAIEECVEPEVGPGTLQRIVVFLSVFDVHVQRAPAAGKVISTRHQEGRMVAAYRKDAGEVNAGRLTVIERPNGDRLGVRQITGLIARRIVTYLSPGQTLARGELIGLIQFGSRVDLYLPQGYEVRVAVGERVVDGETPVAERVAAALPPAAGAEEAR